MSRITLTTVLVAATLVIAGCKGGASTAPSADVRPYRVVIEVSGVYPEQPSAIVKGDTVKVSTNGVVIGVVESVVSTPSPVQVPTADGRLLIVGSPIYRDMRITIVGQAAESSTGLKFPGGQLWVRPGVEFQTPRANFTGAILSIEPVGK